MLKKKTAMDKFVHPYDKEFMKMAMLKHEELFKEQVYELHRLYQIQKMLMKKMQRNSPKVDHGQDEEKCFVNYKFDLEKSAAKDDDENEIEDESEIELTLGPVNNYNRRRSRTKPESINSDSLQSFSSSSTSSTHIIKRRNTRESSSFLSGRKNNTSDDDDNINNNTSMKHPPWLYQVLSLNMT